MPSHLQRHNFDDNSYHKKKKILENNVVTVVTSGLGVSSFLEKLLQGYFINHVSVLLKCDIISLEKYDFVINARWEMGAWPYPSLESVKVERKHFILSIAPFDYVSKLSLKTIY